MSISRGAERSRIFCPRCRPQHRCCFQQQRTRRWVADAKIDTLFGADSFRFDLRRKAVRFSWFCKQLLLEAVKIQVFVPLEVDSQGHGTVDTFLFRPAMEKACDDGRLQSKAVSVMGISKPPFQMKFSWLAKALSSIPFRCAR